jgi:hypothetical protein
MGDYPLKLSPSYAVPEHLRVNYEKKRAQLKLLIQSIYALKNEFNIRLLELRTLKKRIVAQLSAPFNHLPTDEWIDEVQDLVTDEELARFEIELEEDRKREEEARKAKASGGFGGFSGTAKKSADNAHGGAHSSHGHKAPGYTSALLHAVRNNKAVQAFDAALKELGAEKLRLLHDLKQTDSKVLLLLAEMDLLSDFEKRDVSLIQKLDGKRKEKNECLSKLSGCQERLASKKSEIEVLLEKERSLMARFLAIVPQTSDFYEAALRVFKKKVKRKAKPQEKAQDTKAKEESDDEDSDLDDMDDEDLEMEEEEEEEDEEKKGPSDESLVPPSVLAQLEELRETRMDQEDELAEFQKGLDALRKENDNLIGREKTIDAQLKAIEREIQDFQNEKQRNLNELMTIVPLRIHQFLNLVYNEDEGWSLPEDHATQSVVFAYDSWVALENRPTEIASEKNELKRHIKDLKKDSQLLVKSLKDREEIVFQLDAKMYEVQVLKFGRQVDLDALESAAVDPKSEELKDVLVQEESRSNQETQLLDKKIYDLKARVAQLTDEQTKKLTVLAHQREELYQMERELNASSKKGLEMARGEGADEKEEREALKELVVQQAREIEAVKQEIMILRRKGGHVYAPVGV